VSGARLYFTVTKFGQMSSGIFTAGLSGMMPASSKFCPCALTLVHVRLPPGFTVGVQHRPTNVHSAFYQHGPFLARDVIYTSHAYAMMPARLSVTEVHWHIIANLGFKFRSHFTAHCGHCAAAAAVLVAAAVLLAGTVLLAGESSRAMLASARLSCFPSLSVCLSSTVSAASGRYKLRSTDSADYVLREQELNLVKDVSATPFHLSATILSFI